MHIAVDCRSVHKHMGGIGRAALELVRALGTRPGGHRISMIVGADHAGELSIGGVHILPVDAAMIDERFEQLHLPSLLTEIGADFYLNTTFSIPAIKTTKSQVAIIHDVVFEDHPEYVEHGLRAFLSRWSRFSASHADHVLTVSDHARERIQSVYGVDPSKITRVYNGIPSSCFVAPDERGIERVRAEFKLDRPFILYLGTIELKKGIVELLRAYRKARDSGLAELLVLAGGRGGPGFDLDAQIRNEGCEGKVRALGFVDEVDKKALIKASSLFVYPSLYEGFGIPPLEAMALGVPCLVSDQTSLPEIAGGAAKVVRVQNPAEFAQALIKGVGDGDFRRTAAVAGPARAREFTWERPAAQVLELCERLGGN
jgi:glycosyltransferase involved in cell wall biosynthesis